MMQSDEGLAGEAAPCTQAAEKIKERFMKTKILGRTGLEVPIVGLGTIFIGSEPPTGSVNELVLDEDLGAQTVEAAVEAGCTLIDTAPLYGGAVSEKIIGRVLKQRPDLAAKCTVVTKAGNSKDGQDHSFDAILRSVAASQHLLGIEQFEIVYIHDALRTPVEQVMRVDGAFGALRKLQREGVIRYIGSATNDPAINTLYIETGEFDAAVVPNAWSLLNQRAAERILPAAEKHNVGICCGTPLERGILATGPIEGVKYPRRHFSPECVAHVAKIQRLCRDYQIPLLAASLQWPTRHPQVATAIPGARTPSEAVANAKAAKADIPEAFWQDLQPLIQHWDVVDPFK